ncbi:SMP-30/gluconolactonase/LRE family protein [Flavobacteriaceae bacterium]|jgi:gluconolactonase|nr:SMP-30/gluconolactonase/LRE family protein [Flavobacteriaceae bacterium]
MNVILKLVLAVVVGFSFTSLEAQKKTIGSVERLSAEIEQYIPQNAVIEILAEGFDWSEGPVWVEELGAVLFSDVPNNKIYQWDEKKGLQVFRNPSGFTNIVPNSKEQGSNGLTLDANNKLIICMHGDRRIARLDDWNKNDFTTVVGEFEGKLFNSPNDLVYARNGDLYFTDPPYGFKNGDKDSLKQIPFNGVYKLSQAGELSLLVKDLERPNGIALSNDESILYVTNSHAGNPGIMAYDLKADGVSNGRLFFDGKALSKKDKGSFDGLKIHPSGTIFTTGPGGVLVINDKGTHLGTIRTEVRSANCAFGPDFKTLYMTSDNYLTRIKL